MADEYISSEEFERRERFRNEQYKELGLKVIALEKLINNTIPSTSLAPKTRDLLARQVEMLFKKIQYLEKELINLKKSAGIKNGNQSGTNNI